MLTKSLKAETVAAHLQRLGFTLQSGRDTSAPKLMAAFQAPSKDGSTSRRQLRQLLRQQRHAAAQHDDYDDSDDTGC